MIPVVKALELIGDITTVDPVAISTPLKKGGSGNPVPAQTERRYYDGQLVETLVIPASSIRGKLRHIATRLVMEEQTKAGMRFKVRDYLVTALGGVVDVASLKQAQQTETNEAGSDIVQDGAVDLDRQQELRRKNPIVSLFGSMDAAIMSKLHVRAAVPIGPIAPSVNVIGGGTRASPLHREPELFSSGAELFDGTDVLTFIAANTAKVEGNKLEDEAERLVRRARELRRAGNVAAAEAADAEAKVLKTKAAATFEAVGGKVNLQQALWGWQSIPAGTVLRHSMRLERPTEAEAKLFFVVLRAFATHPVVGGHVAVGCGRIAASWKLVIDGEYVGSVHVGGQDIFKVICSDPRLAGVFDADIASLAESIDIRSQA